MGWIGKALDARVWFERPMHPPSRHNQVRRALEMGVNAPKLTMEGFGGTYFMYDPRKRPLGAWCFLISVCLCTYMCWAQSNLTDNIPSPPPITACFKPADEEPYAPNNPRGPELVADWGMVRA